MEEKLKSCPYSKMLKHCYEGRHSECDFGGKCNDRQ